MEIVAALIVYVIVTIGLIIILIRSNIRTFSAIVISMIIGQILMNIICPPPSIAYKTTSVPFLPGKHTRTLQPQF